MWLIGFWGKMDDLLSRKKREVVEEKF